MKRFFYIFLSLILIICSCTGQGIKPEVPGSEGDQGTTDTPVTEPNEFDGIVGNAKMEEDIPLDLKSAAVEGNWSYLGGWHQERAQVYHVENRGYKGSKCLAISAPNGTVDVGFGQVIKLIPEQPYKISARIKTDGVSGGAGAHLSLDYLWAPRSRPVVGTTDWTNVTLEIEPPTEEVVLCLKLGGTAADCSGVAYFDNVTVSFNDDLYIKESEHIKLVIDKSHLSVSESLIEQWLDNLDEAYKSYQELFKGKIPYEKNRMVIRAAPGIDAWAYAGDPIQWNSDYISSTLLQLQKGDWIFGILHEMGHNFAPGSFGATYAWNFNEELFANFRMYYVLDNLNGTIVQTAKIYNSDGTSTSVEKKYVGKEIMQLYKSECDNGYDMTIAKNRAVEMGNALCYCLCRMVEQYGWQLWIDTFDYLYKVTPEQKPEYAGMTGWDKFEYLMDALSLHNYEDVRNSFTKAELNVIKEYLQTQKI